MRFHWLKFGLILTVITLAIGASAPDRLIQKANDTQAKLTALFDAAKADPRVFLYDLPQAPEKLPDFKDERFGSIIKNLNELKKSLYELTANESKTRINPSDKRFKRLSETAKTYMTTVQGLNLFYARAVHMRGAPKKEDSFQRFESLNLNFKKNAFTLNLLSQLAPLNVRHTSNNELELFMTELDHENSEYSALQEIDSRYDYAKFLQFSAVRERLVNRWALQRMSPSSLFNQKVDQCSLETLSFRFQGTQSIKDSAAYIALTAEDRFQAFQTILPTLYQQMKAMPLGGQKVDFYRAITDSTIGQLPLLLYLTDNARMYNNVERLAESEQILAGKADDLRKSEIERFEQSPEGDRPSQLEAILQHSLFNSDDWNIEAIAARIASEVTQARKELILFLAAHSASDFLRNTCDHWKPESLAELPPDIRSTLDSTAPETFIALFQSQSHIESLFKKNAASYQAAIKKKIIPILESALSPEVTKNLALKRRSEKLDELKKQGMHLAQYAYEARRINQISEDNDVLVKQFQIPADIKIIPTQPKDLQMMLLRLIESRKAYGFLRKNVGYEATQRLLGDFFSNVSTEFQANLIYRELPPNKQAALRKSKKDFIPTDGDPNTELLAKIAKKVALQIQYENPPESKMIDVAIRNQKMDRYSNSPAKIEEFINAGEAFARLMDTINLRRNSSRGNANSNRDLAFSLLHRKALINSEIDSALDNTPMLRTEMEDKVANPNYKYQRPSNYSVPEDPYIITVMSAAQYFYKAYNPTTGAVDAQSVNNTVLSAFDRVYKNESNALERFCSVDLTKYDSDEFRALFQSTGYLRQVMDSSSKKVQRIGEELAKMSRTRAQVLLDDYVFPAMTYSMIGFGVLSLVFLPFAGAVAAAGAIAVQSSLMATITFASHLTFGLLTAASLTLRAQHNWIETPMQLRYQETLIASQMVNSPNLVKLEGMKEAKAISTLTREKLNASKMENGTARLFDVVMLPLDYMFMGPLAKEIKRAAGYYAVKNLSKIINRPIRFFLRSPALKVQEMSGLSQEFATFVENMSVGKKVVTSQSFKGSQTLTEHFANLQAKSMSQKARATVSWLSERAEYMKLWLPNRQVIATEEIKSKLKSELAAEITDIGALEKVRAEIVRHIELLKVRKLRISEARATTQAFKSEAGLTDLLNERGITLEFGMRDLEVKPEGVYIWSFTGAKAIGQTFDVLKVTAQQLKARGASSAEITKELVKAAFGSESRAANWVRRNGEIFEKVSTWREVWLQGKITKMEGWLAKIDEVGINVNSDPMYLVRNNTTLGREFLKVVDNEVDMSLLKEVAVKPGFFARDWTMAEKVKLKWDGGGPLMNMEDIFKKYDDVLKAIKPIEYVTEIKSAGPYKTILTAGAGPRPPPSTPEGGANIDDIILDETKDLSIFFEVSVVTDAPKMDPDQMKELFIKLTPKTP